MEQRIDRRGVLSPWAMTSWPAPATERGAAVDGTQESRAAKVLAKKPCAEQESRTTGSSIFKVVAVGALVPCFPINANRALSY